jgi:hypothetical protein
LQLELKHTLETIPPLVEALKGCQNSLLQAILNNLQDPKIEALQVKLEDVVREDAIWVKNSQKMRNQVRPFTLILTPPSLTLCFSHSWPTR